MDYALPRADMLPSFTTGISEVLTPTNRLGVRGAGEGGTTGALGAVVNAVVDALAQFGVTHIEMPVTPERVWRAIQSAKVMMVPRPKAARSAAPYKYPRSETGQR
jgi:aerobic carbon-monoxide dehydrogenase large subunit